MADATGKAEAAKDPAIQKTLDTIALDQARAEARKAEADADTAVAAARTAATKAAWAEIPAAPYSGAVTQGEGALLAEQNHLVRRDLDRLASEIAEAVLKHAKGKNVYLTSDASIPSVSAAQTFSLQQAVVTRGLPTPSNFRGGSTRRRRLRKSTMWPTRCRWQPRPG